MSDLRRIEWMDASRASEWTTVEALTGKAPVCISVGHLVRVDPDTITMALTKGRDDNDICCDMVIPRGMIISISEVRIGKKIRLP